MVYWGLFCGRLFWETTNSKRYGAQVCDRKAFLNSSEAPLPLNASDGQCQSKGGWACFFRVWGLGFSGPV